jgi:GNAT superfamily N-acetyltransferase
MNDIIIKDITGKDSDLLLQVEKQFVEMYDYFSLKGLNISLIKNGEELWINSIMPTLNRLNKLLIAVYNDKVVGFAFGYLRFTPDYQGSLKVGSISYLYVSPDIRGKGIGSLLVKDLENWFISKEVHSIELQVIFKDKNAMTFWGKCGYNNSETIQFRKKENH